MSWEDPSDLPNEDSRDPRNDLEHNRDLEALAARMHARVERLDETGSMVGESEWDREKSWAERNGHDQ